MSFGHERGVDLAGGVDRVPGLHAAAGAPAVLNRLHSALELAAIRDLGVLSRLEAQEALGPRPHYEAWRRLREGLDPLQLPEVLVSAEEVRNGLCRRYLPHPACESCAGTGIIICPDCAETDSPGVVCARCRGSGSLPCGCVERFAFDVPPQALSGYVARGVSAQGHQRFRRLVSPTLAKRWRPAEQWVWLALMVLGGLGLGLVGVISGVDANTYAAGEGQSPGGLLILLGVLGFAVGLSAAMVGLRVRPWAWWCLTPVAAVVLAGLVVLSVLLVLALLGDPTLGSAEVAGLSLVVALPAVPLLFWLSRWFSPAVRGVYDSTVPGVHRLGLRAIPLRERLGALRQPRGLRLLAAALGVWALGFVVAPLVLGKHWALPRAAIALALGLDGAAATFVQPWIAELDRLLSEAPAAAAAQWPDQARTPSKRLARWIWLHSCLRVFAAADDWSAQPAAAALAKRKALLDGQLAQELPDRIRQRANSALAAAIAPGSAGDFWEVRRWWAILEAYCPDSPAFDQVMHPAQPWRFWSAGAPSPIDRLLVERHLSYSEGDYHVREVWRDAEQGEELVEVPITVLLLGVGTRELASCYFAIGAGGLIYQPLGFVTDEGCYVQLATDVSGDDPGPVTVNARLAFAVPPGFSGGTLLMMGTPVGAVPSEPIAGAVAPSSYSDYPGLAGGLPVPMGEDTDTWTPGVAPAYEDAPPPPPGMGAPMPPPPPPG